MSLGLLYITFTTTGFTQLLEYYMKYFKIAWYGEGGHTLASYATGGRSQGQGRGRLHGPHTQSALLCGEWRRTAQSLPQWRFLFSVPLCTHSKQKTNGCRGTSQESKLQGSSRTRGFAEMDKAQAYSSQCACPLTGCRTLNKGRRILSQDAGALLKLDANNYFRDDCYGCCCWGLVGTMMVSFVDCKLLIVTRDTNILPNRPQQ